jgi:hypothetical protein
VFFPVVEELWECRNGECRWRKAVLPVTLTKPETRTPSPPRGGSAVIWGDNSAFGRIPTN